MSAVAAASQPAQQEDGGIPIESLPLEELAKVKKSLDQEQTALIKNFEQLKFAMNSYMRSKRAVEALSETEVGSETLIPLTNAMYEEYFPPCRPIPAASASSSRAKHCPYTLPSFATSMFTRPSEWNRAAPRVRFRRPLVLSFLNFRG